jgi:hypothetical protein
VDVLERQQWVERSSAHEQRIDRLTAPYRAARASGKRHPVHDFLFTYYSLRPARLRRWQPGAGVTLRAVVAEELGRFGRGHRLDIGGLTVDVEAVLDRRGDSIRWIGSLLSATAGRAPSFGCFGLHEWAMVYGQSADEVRHAGWPLRLSPERTQEIVRERGVKCSHFDAFRFFTPAARPLNETLLTRELQIGHEQPGCLHAGMDLYKWAYKLDPLVSGELLADCFELARDIRELDMRASPYDLSELYDSAEDEYRPVLIETAAGRAEYAVAQRGFTARGNALRARLIDLLERL